MKEQTNFLGTKKISSLLKMFAIPCVLSLIIQALYNLVDQIFIGHQPTLGALGNAATGIVYPITVIALAIGLWLGDGAASSISLNQGKNDTKNISKSVGTAIITGVVISLILMIVSFIFKKQILTSIGASNQVLPFALEYSTLIISGFIFYILACVINPIIRTDGSPKYAMLAMCSGAIINIILDPIFIYSFDMGMTGASLATLIGQIITFVMHISYLFKSKNFKLKLADFIPDFKLLKLLFQLGISSFLTQIAIVIISIVNNKLLYMHSLTSGYDVNITQGVLTLAFKVFGIIISIVVGIASGGQPILGYNYGAKKNERVKECFKLIMTSTIIVGLIATVLFEFCPQVFLFIFGDGGNGVDTAAYESFTIKTFRIYLGFILFTCIIKVISIFFQAIGKPVKAAIVSLSRDIVFIVPLAILFSSINGIDLLLWSAPVADSLGFILSLVLIIITLKSLKSIKEEEYEIADIKPSKRGIIVTISREHGTRGRAIGLELSKLLDVPFYDKELTLLVAEKTGLSKEYINSTEDLKIGIIRDLYLSLSPTAQAINAQRKILEEIAQKGSCVIVGRAADYVLQKYDLCRVFIYAPIEFRKQNIINGYKDDEDEAVKRINASDKKRGNFYYTISGRTWNDSKNYDLMINSKIGVKETAQIIYNYVMEMK